MSGGHFNNEEWQLNHPADLLHGELENFRIELKEYYPDLSKELRRRMEKLCEFYELMHAYDYWVCGDWGRERFDKEALKLLKKLLPSDPRIDNLEKIVIELFSMMDDGELYRVDVPSWREAKKLIDELEETNERRERNRY